MSHPAIPEQFPRRASEPRFHRFMLGDAEITVVSDGPLPIGDPLASFSGPPPEELTRQLYDDFQPTSDLVLEQNAVVLDTGNRKILFDTGLGVDSGYGSTNGKLQENLLRAGIAAAEIDAVVLSHAHIDHCGGCIGRDGERMFPNAHFYMAESDFQHWTDVGMAPPEMRSFYEAARHNLLPNRDRMSFFRDGQEFLPGVQAISAPGHTIGHTIFGIASGGKQLCYTADLAHHAVLHLENPLTEFAFDTDPKMSAQTRKRLLERFASDRTLILAYHFPWPGVGHVARRGDGFRFHPEAMRTRS